MLSQRNRRMSALASDASFQNSFIRCFAKDRPGGKCVESIPYFLLGPEQPAGRGGRVRQGSQSQLFQKKLCSSLSWLDSPMSPPSLKAQAAASLHTAAPSPWSRGSLRFRPPLQRSRGFCVALGGVSWEIEYRQCRCRSPRFFFARQMYRR